MRVLLFITTLFILVVVNLYDLKKLLDGDGEFINSYSGFLFTLAMLPMFPMILNKDIYNSIGNMVIIYFFYIVVYVFIYIKIKNKDR